MVISLNKMTGIELASLRKEHYKDRHAWQFLPKWTLNEINGTFIEAEYYLQWTEFDEREFYLFDIVNCDKLLEEEISAIGGLDELTEKFDFRELFSNLSYNNFEHYSRQFPVLSYIVFEMLYSGSGHMGMNGDYDCDLDVLVHGYLNEAAELVKI